MANPQSSGSGPGVEDARPPASPSAESAPSVPTLEDIASLAEKLVAGIVLMRGAAAEGSPPAASAGATPASSPTGQEGGEGEGEGEEDDGKESGLGVDDTPTPTDLFPPLKTAIEAQRTRLSLADSILAGVDADLDADDAHLEGQRLSHGNHQDVICLARRILQKTVDELDSVRVGPLVRETVATALEMHAKGEKDFDAYGDTPEDHEMHRRAAESLAAQGERAASGS